MSVDHLEYSRFKLNQHVYSRQIMNILMKSVKHVSTWMFHNFIDIIYTCVPSFERKLCKFARALSNLSRYYH